MISKEKIWQEIADVLVKVSQTSESVEDRRATIAKKVSNIFKGYPRQDGIKLAAEIAREFGGVIEKGCVDFLEAIALEAIKSTAKPEESGYGAEGIH